MVIALEPEVILPEQLSLHRDHWTGERRLAFAILADAVGTLVQPIVVGAKPSFERELESAKRWFESDDDSWPFAFVNVASLLGLDPEYLRQIIASRLIPARLATAVRGEIRQLKRHAAINSCRRLMSKPAVAPDDPELPHLYARNARAARGRAR